MAIEETVEAYGFDGRVAVLGSLRRGEGSVECFLGYLCGAYACGVGVDWGVLFSSGVGRRVELPTYAFQRKRYWLRSGGVLGDAGSLGMSVVEHPLLGSSLDLAGGGEGWLFAGRLSLRDVPWLEDHVVLDTVILPGVVFVELALVAAQSIGLGEIEEITLLAPLVLEEQRPVQLQLAVSEPDQDGRCELAVYSRVQSGGGDLGGSDQQWTQHATGILSGVLRRVPGELEEFADRVWPPDGAEELQTGSFYDRAAETGYDYGPAFQGLKAAWRHADDIYAEAVLQDDQLGEANSYCIHPALLDAALHIALLTALDELGSQEAQIPFTFSGVRLYARGASSLRVHLSNPNNDSNDSDGESSDVRVSGVLAVDAGGMPVLSIDAMRTRPVERGALQAAKHRGGLEDLYELQWVELSTTTASSNGSTPRIAVLDPEHPQNKPKDQTHKDQTHKDQAGGDLTGGDLTGGDLTGGGGSGLAGMLGEGVSLERYGSLDGLRSALEGGVSLPEYVVVGVGGLVGSVGQRAAVGGVGQRAAVGGGLLDAIHVVSECVLGLLQGWLAGECFGGARLVFVSEGALVVREGEDPDLLQAPLVGLLRSAHSEHPERFSLIDIDHSPASHGQLSSALATGQSELAIRDGSLYVPRLARIKTSGSVSESVALRSLDPEGTVLVSGGTGGLGAVLARHLVGVHGVRRLVLLSRSGLGADGAGELLEGLTGLGCEVQIVACDVCDRGALERLVADIPVEHPLSMVVHTAGVLDDGVISSLDGERLRSVMAPKIEGALYLHELTQHSERCEFVLFSSSTLRPW